MTLTVLFFKNSILNLSAFSGHSAIGIVQLQLTSGTSNAAPIMQPYPELLLLSSFSLSNPFIFPGDSEDNERERGRVNRRVEWLSG